MAEDITPVEMADIGKKLGSVIRSYSGHVAETVKIHSDAAGDGPLPYVVAIIDREQEGLSNALTGLPDFSSYSGDYFSDRQLKELQLLAALIDDIAPKYDRESEHQKELADAFEDDQNVTIQERRRIKAGATRLGNLIPLFLKMTGLVLEQQLTRPPRKPNVITPAKDQQSGETPMAKTIILDQSPTVEAIGEVTDALSLLQKDGRGYGGSGSIAGNQYNAFGTMLDQKLQLTLGMPNLNSDGALAADNDDLVEKLFDGLDRTVVTEDNDGIKTYSVNPLRARGGTLGADTVALGAQAVAADTIRGLKSSVLDNLYRLEPETVYGNQDEADDLRRAVEEGIDKLIAEATAELGAFDIWAEEIFEQIYLDVLSLASLYGIKNVHEAKPFLFILGRLGDTPNAILSAIPIDPARDRVLRDPDIGILTAEANDKAISAILFTLSTMRKLLVDDASLGPYLGRVRLLNEAIASSVISSRNALASAGISIQDQSVAFSGLGQNSIDLRRLLAWIETESIMARPVLLRPDLNGRDLDRLRSARATQHAALAKINALDFPTVNANQYALGRRHLAELEGHLADIERLITMLIKQSAA